MCNTHKGAVRFRLTQTLREIAILTECRDALCAQFQKECKHPEVAEHDRGPNNYSVRVCVECTLKEEAWVDEAGMCHGYEKLIGAKDRVIRQVASAAELQQYETLRP